MKNEATKSKEVLYIKNHTLTQGNLFREVSDEGDEYYWYYVGVEVTVEDGRTFAHHYSHYGRGAEELVQAFADKVAARGFIIVANGWTEVPTRPSLEEIWNEEAYIEDQCRQGLRYEERFA